MFPLTLLSRAWNEDPAKSTPQRLGESCLCQRSSANAHPAWAEATRRGANPTASWAVVHFESTTK